MNKEIRDRLVQDAQYRFERVKVLADLIEKLENSLEYCKTFHLEDAEHSKPWFSEPVEGDTNYIEYRARKRVLADLSDELVRLVEE